MKTTTKLPDDVIRPRPVFTLGEKVHCRSGDVWEVRLVKTDGKGTT